ncbi:hypothetical protein ACFYXH_41930 [Streptomyces sp. NPDC002730]|uniref:hypothetical protein n=1 Tax=Streptomyces sp. NPDC002730 TaxID=3364662 RepID=UPI00368EADF5
MRAGAGRKTHIHADSRSRFSTRSRRAEEKHATEATRTVDFGAVESERPAGPGRQPQGSDVGYMLMADYRAGRYHHDED